MSNPIFLLLVLACAIPLPASAHDLYLLPPSAANGRQVCAGIGEHFPASMNAVTADRLSSFRALTPAGQPAELKGKPAGKEFCAPLPQGGPAIVEMTVQPRYIRLKPKDFKEYVTGEGLTQVLERRSQGDLAAKDGTELYSRFSKLLLGRGSDFFTQPVGHVLEIVPERDPASLKPKEALRVRVLFRGKPLADAQIAAVYARAELKGHQFPVTTRTDADGWATLALDRPGLWYARLIHMTPASDDPEIDWRSYFATLTFEIPVAK